MTLADLEISLPEPDMRTKPAKIAQEFMVNKGFKVRPFAYLQGGEAHYFYFKLPNSDSPRLTDLLELEVVLRGPAEWDCAVACFRTNV